jgi:hypothetical protein
MNRNETKWNGKKSRLHGFAMQWRAAELAEAKPSLCLHDITWPIRVLLQIVPLFASRFGHGSSKIRSPFRYVLIGLEWFGYIRSSAWPHHPHHPHLATTILTETHLGSFRPGTCDADRAASDKQWQSQQLTTTGNSFMTSIRNNRNDDMNQNDMKITSWHKLAHVAKRALTLSSVHRCFLATWSTW